MNKKTNSYQIRRFLCLLVLGVLAAAYWDVGSASAADLKIGVVQHFTGSAAEYGLQIAEGARLARDLINRSGGVNGGKIILVEEDEGPPANAVAVIRKLAATDIVAVIGPQRTSSGIACAPVVPELKLPLFSMSVTKWEAGPYIFKPAMVESDAYPVVLQTLMKDCGVKTGAVIVAHEDDYAQLLKKEWVATAEKLGIKVLRQEVYTTGDTDFRVQLTNIKAANPDVLFMSGLVGETAPMMEQARELKITSVIQVATADPTMFKLSGGASDGAVSASPWNPKSSRPQFVELTKRWRETRTKDISIWSSYGYDILHVIAEAAKKIRTNTDREALRKQVGSNQVFEAALGKYRFNGSGPNLEMNFTVFVLRGSTTEPYNKSLIPACRAK